MAEDVKDRLARTWKRLDVAKGVLEWAQEALAEGDEARALRLEKSVFVLLEILLGRGGEWRIHGVADDGARVEELVRVSDSQARRERELIAELDSCRKISATWELAAVAAEATIAESAAHIVRLQAEASHAATELFVQLRQERDAAWAESFRLREAARPVVAYVISPQFSGGPELVTLAEGLASAVIEGRAP